MKFTNINIGKRLAIAFGVTTLLTLVLLLVSFQTINKLTGQWDGFHDIVFQKNEAVSKGVASLGDAIHHFKNYLLRGQDYDKKFMDDLAAIDNAAASYINNHGEMNEREKSALQHVREGAEIYRVAIKSRRNEDIGRFY